MTAAFNPDNYGLSFSETASFCFMRMAPFLGALAVPAAVLTALLVGFGLSAWCAAKNCQQQGVEPVDGEKTVQVNKCLVKTAKIQCIPLAEGLAKMDHSQNPVK